MPLPKRSISPVHVSRHRLPGNIRRDELECTANGTLANLVRQLSSLSRHAEDVFGELYHEAMKIEHRTNTLATRMDRLALKVTKLDSNEEHTSLQDIGLRKPYKSNVLVDQQSLSRHTLPAAMTECYGQADTPPDLDALNMFREDGRSGLKFYTDPEYFFELWRQEMLKSGDKKAKQLKPVSTSTESASAQRRNKRVRQPRDTREELVNRVISKFPEEYQTPEFMRQAHAARALQFAGEQQQVPAGMVRPSMYDTQHNGHYNTQAHASQSHSHGHASSSAHSMQQPNIQQSHSYMAHNQSAYEQAQSQIYGQVQRAQPAAHTQQPPSQQQYNSNPAHNQHNQYYQAQSDMYHPPTSSEHSTNSTPRPNTNGNGNAVGGQLPQSPSNHSDLSNRSRGGTPLGQRPAHAPPAPPLNDMRQMKAQLDDMRLMDGADSPDFPPPPPALMSQSIMSSNDVMPEPPPDVFGGMGGQGQSAVPPAPPLLPGGNIPPAPPPPPPMSQFAAPMKSIQAGNGTAKAPIKTVKDEPKAALLAAIRDGIQLKKIEKQGERQREQAAAAEGHDVAAILRKRMQDVMGQDDSEEDTDDEYKDEWED